MTYTTVRQAREAGATGTNLQVARAVELADAVVDRFTGQAFTPQVRTLVVDVVDGVARLPYRLAAGGITAVASTLGTAYGPGTYATTSSSVEGQVDTLRLNPLGSILVAGMEPWAHPVHPRQLQVTGTFGWDTVPDDVAQAAALIAAHLASTMVQEGSDASGGQTTTTADPEGNVLPVVPPFPAGDAGEDGPAPVDSRRSTGVRAADALLMRYRLTAPLFQAV